MKWQEAPIISPAPPKWAQSPIVELPQDTGQGYASSLVNSAGRGFARVAADIPGGLGYLTGSDSLVQLGDDIEDSINDALPVNPIYQDDFAMKAAGAVGQAGSMFATGGVGGAIGKGFGAVRAGAEIAALGSGFLAGARGGGQDAEQYGMTGGSAYARILAGGAIEVATEKWLFGMGTETRAMQRLLGETIEGGGGRLFKDILTEGGEEWVAEVSNNAANKLLAPAGVETPGLLHGSLEATALGMVGGATFGGFNAITSRGGNVVEERTLMAPAGSTPPPAMPGPPVSAQIAGQQFYFDGTQWTVPVDPSTVSASPELEAPFRPLNPAHPIEGTLIVALENQRHAVMRKGGNAPAPRPENGFPARGTPESTALWDWVDSEKAAGREVPGMTEYTQEQYSENYSSANAIAAETKILNAYKAHSVQQAEASPADMTLGATSDASIDTPSSEVTADNQGVENAPNVDNQTDTSAVVAPGKMQPRNGEQKPTGRSASASLPDTTGTDIITALQGENMRLGQISEGGEWDWYRELEKAATTSKLKKQEVAARVRRGELEDPAALFEWVNQNIVDRQQGGKIDEAAALLNEMDGYQSFNVDANSIGPAIMEAIGQRQKSREQGGLDEYMAKQEADHVEFERQQTRDFLTHAFASDAPALSGNQLSQQVEVGSTIRLNGVDFKVAEVNESEGTLALQDDSGKFGYQNILAEDSLPVESVDGNATERYEVEEVPEDRIAFSRVDRSSSESQDSNDDNAFEHLQFRPRADSELGQNELDAIEHIRRSEGDATIYAASPFPQAGSGQGAARGSAAKESIDALEKAFGKKVLFVARSTGPLSFDGASPPGSRNVLVLDYQSRAPLMYLTGHELIHALKAQRPELWKEMRDGLLSMASDWQDYKDRLKGRYKESEFEDEFLGDFVGGEFRNPEFWKQAAEMNPTTFGRLARAALDFLSNILKKLTGYRMEVQQYFQDLEAARAVVIDALGKYSADGVFPDRVLEESSDDDLTRLDRATVDVSKVPDPGAAMRLVSMRLSEASDSLREMLKPHQATRDSRTVDGEPIEQAGYLVRRDADMEAMANQWLDSFAEESARKGQSMEEARAELSNVLNSTGDHPQRLSADVAAVIMTQLLDGRGGEFGYDPREIHFLAQRNAGVAARALREQQKILDPLDKLVSQANTNTGTTIAKELGTEIPQDGKGKKVAADVPAVMNQQLQDELKAEANKAALDAIESLRSANSDLRKSLKEAKERAEEERTRADQEREVGISIGREEGLEQGRAEQPPAPPRELDVFENWLMGEKVEGLPSLEQVARRFLQPQRWDGERFRSALRQLFPALDQNILDDAVDRITEQMNNRIAAARRRAVTAFLDRLAERNKRLQNDQRFVTFYGHLQKAVEFGILDSQVFADSFAAAWGLNGLTPAVVMQLRQMYQQITATNSNGQPVHYGMVRETMERRFIEAVNRIAPGQAWLNFIFNNYQARVLSSASSILNQFSAVFRILAPVDAVARSYRMGQAKNPSVVLSEYWEGMSSLGRNLPLMLTAIRGESLGHLPSMLAKGYVPSEQQTQHLQPGEALRVGNTQLGSSLSWLARMSELWTWRTIRAAEGLTGIADAEAHFRETLINHYRDQGMSPAAARQQALKDIHASPQVIAAAKQQAEREQRAGTIGTGRAVIERRIQEIVQREIDTRLSLAATDRAERLTDYTQFKTMPAGPIGFTVSKLMAGITKQDSKAGQVARFWFLFGRFLGHTVDVTLGYTPGAHFLTRNTGQAGSARNKLIREVFGSEENYRHMVDSRALTGASFLMMTGALMALALSMADDDDEPFFVITGGGGLGDQSRKDALKATGKWGEMQIRVGGRPILGYSQIPELAPLLSILGNLSDHVRFGEFLNQRSAREGEQPGKYPADWSTVGFGMAADYALSPIKRSTYRGWFDLMDGLMGIQSAGGADYAAQQFISKLTQPIDGMLRVPVVVDVDKALKFSEGSLKPDGIAEGILRRVPFTSVGQEVYNAYGERSAAWDIFTMFPTSPALSKEAEQAARLNVETGTRRSAPKDISLHYADGSVRELKADELTAYQQLSGQIYTESLLRNEADIRRAYQQGGQGAAAKIVENISAKANKEAKKRLGL